MRASPDVQEAVLRHAAWRQGDFSYGQRLNLAGADLRGVCLSGLDLSYAVLSKAELTGADLVGTALVGTALVEANLTTADLRGADLSRACLVGALLPAANLSKANLTDTDFRRADLRSANLQHTIGLPPALHVPNLDVAVLAALTGAANALLRASSTAPRHATQERAEWACLAAGAAGESLHKSHGLYTAAALIYAASGSHPVPTWGAPQTVWDDLYERAACAAVAAYNASR